MDGIMIKVYGQQLSRELTAYQIGHNSVADAARFVAGSHNGDSSRSVNTI
jgi:hypothetical protein